VVDKVTRSAEMMAGLEFVQAQVFDNHYGQGLNAAVVGE
jgi:hypothetical protein